MVLWWLANAILLLVVAPYLILLANHVLRPATEIRKCADDILEHGVALSKNVEPIPALSDTRSSISRIKGLAVRYLSSAGKLL